ncbi:hypothetical protein [Treponema endosymbiont of Eucomonympha sp.]|nr:hypothetical protein [Treponema endosymbiont of Eucomonympha sp.]
MGGEAAIKPIVRISGYCGYQAGFVGVSTSGAAEQSDRQAKAFVL